MGGETGDSPNPDYRSGTETGSETTFREKRGQARIFDSSLAPFSFFQRALVSSMPTGWLAALRPPSFVTIEPPTPVRSSRKRSLSAS